MGIATEVLKPSVQRETALAAARTSCVKSVQLNSVLLGQQHQRTASSKIALARVLIEAADECEEFETALDTIREAMNTVEGSSQARSLVVTQALVVHDLVCSSLQVQRLSRMVTCQQGKCTAKELLRTSCDAFSFIQASLLPSTHDCLWEANSWASRITGPTIRDSRPVSRGLRSADRSASVSEVSIPRQCIAPLIDMEMRKLLKLQHRNQRDHEELMMLQMHQISHKLENQSRSLALHLRHMDMHGETRVLK